MELDPADVAAYVDATSALYAMPLDATLPVGVQLIGRPNSESLLLALAEALERRGVAGAGVTPVAA